MQKIGGWSQANRDRVADLLFFQTKEIGLSLLALNIGGEINSKIPNQVSASLSLPPTCAGTK